MSEVKEILALMRLHDSVKKEFKEKAAEISRGEFPESFEKETDKKTRSLLNNYTEKDVELSKFNHENDKENFEKVFAEKYEKEFYKELEEFAEQWFNEYFEPYDKKLEEIDRKLVDSPTKSLLLASSLYYGEKGAAGAKKTGRFSLKIGKNTGKFVGNKIKDGAIHLWDNKEEIRDKMVDAAMKNQEQVDKKYSRLENKYKRYSNDQLIEVIRDENMDRIDRGMANKILKERQ